MNTKKLVSKLVATWMEERIYKNWLEVQSGLQQSGTELYNAIPQKR